MAPTPDYYIAAQNRRMFTAYALADAQNARRDAERSEDAGLIKRAESFERYCEQRYEASQRAEARALARWKREAS